MAGLTPEERARVRDEIRATAAVRAPMVPHEREAVALLVIVGLPRDVAEEAVGYALSDSIETAGDVRATDPDGPETPDVWSLALHALWWSDGVARGTMQDGGAPEATLQAHDAASERRAERMSAMARAGRAS